VDPNALDLVLLTHLHGDHFGGLHLLLIDAKYNSLRKRPLVIAGPLGTRQRVEEWSSLAFGGSGQGFPFELRFVVWAPGDKGKVEGREVRTFRAHHMSPEDGALQLRVRTDGTTLAFTGDTGWTDEVVSLADGADLLVSECTDLHPVTEGHIAWDQLEPRLKELRARRIVLTHLGPEMCSRRKTIRAPRVRLAEDGMTLRVSRPAKRA